MLCQFLLCNVNQLHVHAVLLLAPPVYPIPTLQVITEHRTELSVLHSGSRLPSYFTHGSVYMSTLLSQVVPLSFFPTAYIILFSTFVSLFLPCKQVHQYHFSRFCVCVSHLFVSNYLRHPCTVAHQASLSMGFPRQ